MQVVMTTTPHDTDKWTLASPNPRVSQSVFKVLRPLSGAMWLGVIAALPLMATVFYCLSRREEKFVGLELNQWSSSWERAIWLV